MLLILCLNEMRVKKVFLENKIGASRKYLGQVEILRGK